MSAQPLARLVDPGALDTSTGPRARLRIEIPPAWLAIPSDIDVVVPPRLPCARCDGGGCDGCDRSGALRAPDDESERTLSVSLPGGADDGVALRLGLPFGRDFGVDQLILEIRPSEEPSPGVSRRVSYVPRDSGTRGALGWPALSVLSVCAAGALVVAVLLLR